ITLQITTAKILKGFGNLIITIDPVFHLGNIISTMTIYHSTTNASNSTTKPSSIMDADITGGFIRLIGHITLLQITTAELPKDFDKSHNSNRPSYPFGTMLKDQDSSDSPTPIPSLSLQTSNIKHQGNIISTMTMCVTTVYHSTMHPSNSTSKPPQSVILISETLNREFLE
ncbi:19186_t:CDS:2, partial [Racocetra persica]